MTGELAHAIFDVLVARAGADPGQRGEFVQQPHDRLHRVPVRGSLGFGGKLYVERCGWRVAAYPEDIARWPDMRRVIDVTNAALVGLWARAKESTDA